MANLSIEECGMRRTAVKIVGTLFALIGALEFLWSIFIILFMTKIDVFGDPTVIYENWFGEFSGLAALYVALSLQIVAAIFISTGAFLVVFNPGKAPDLTAPKD